MTPARFAPERDGHNLSVPYEIECLHCGKRFRAEQPLRGTSAAQTGFKCPHCGLLVSLPRAKGEDALERVEDY